MTATSAIKINGVLGSREDLTIGSPVSLTNSDNTGATTWAWTFISKPPNSAATISGATTATASFTPDIVGSYLIQLTVSDGVLNYVDKKIGAVKTANFGIRIPAASEQTEFSTTNGWSEAVYKGFKAIDDYALYTNISATDGYALVWNNSVSKWTPQIQDAYRIQNRKVSSSVPSDGNVLTWNASGNNWIPQAPTGGSLPVISNDGYVMVWNNSASTWSPQIQDAYRIQNRKVDSTAPTDGYALIWEATSNSWKPKPISSILTSGAAVITEKVLSADFTISNTASWGTYYQPVPATTWQDIDNGGTDKLSITITTLNNEYVEFTVEGFIKPSVSADHMFWIGIDVDGTVEYCSGCHGPNTTDTAAPFIVTHSKLFTAGSHTIKAVGLRHALNQNVIVIGSVHASFEYARIRAKQYLGGSNSTSLQGRSINSATPTDGYALIWNNSASVWTPQIQDAYRIQNRKVASTAPTDGYALTWSTASSNWTPKITVPQVVTTETTNNSDAVTSAFTTYADVVCSTGPSPTLNITTIRNNEVIMIHFCGWILQGSGTKDAMVRISIGGSDYPTNGDRLSGITGQYAGNISFSYIHVFPSAGTYTIKLRGSAASGQSWTLQAGARLSAVRIGSGT